MILSKLRDRLFPLDLARYPRVEEIARTLAAIGPAQRKDRKDAVTYALQTGGTIPVPDLGEHQRKCGHYFATDDHPLDPTGMKL